MALLIIGAGLSFKKIQPRFFSVLMATGIKTGVLPLMGVVMFRVFDVPPGDYIPGMIVLAAPVATLTYILATQMEGDPDFAVAAISVSTLVSAATYTLWLGVLAPV